MAKKVYRVVAVIGRKSNIVFESSPFDASDGRADYNAFRQAIKEKDDHCLSLWREGYVLTWHGDYLHPEKNINGGRIEIIRCSK